MNYEESKNWTSIIYELLSNEVLKNKKSRSVSFFHNNGWLQMTINERSTLECTTISGTSNGNRGKKRNLSVKVDDDNAEALDLFSKSFCEVDISSIVNFPQYIKKIVKLEHDALYFIQSFNDGTSLFVKAWWLVKSLDLKVTFQVKDLPSLSISIFRDGKNIKISNNESSIVLLSPVHLEYSVNNSLSEKDLKKVLTSLSLNLKTLLKDNYENISGFNLVMKLL